MWSTLANQQTVTKLSTNISNNQLMSPLCPVDEVASTRKDQNWRNNWKAAKSKLLFVLRERKGLRLSFLHTPLHLGRCLAVVEVTNNTLAIDSSRETDSMLENMQNSALISRNQQREGEETEKSLRGSLQEVDICDIAYRHLKEVEPETSNPPGMKSHHLTAGAACRNSPRSSKQLPNCYNNSTLEPTDSRLRSDQ